MAAIEVVSRDSSPPRTHTRTYYRYRAWGGHRPTHTTTNYAWTPRAADLRGACSGRSPGWCRANRR